MQYNNCIKKGLALFSKDRRDLNKPYINLESRLGKDKKFLAIQGLKKASPHTCLQCPGRTRSHICGTTQSSLGQLGKTPPEHHLRGGCRCPDTTLVDDIWINSRITFFL